MATVKQTVSFNASPSAVFNALMDQKQHAQFTDSPAKIEYKVGGKFSVWDGYATGETLELVEDRKIVQSWRASDWPEGQFSKLTIELLPESGKTQLNFVQENVPDDQEDDIAQGWQDFYWKPLKKYLEK